MIYQRRYACLMPSASHARSAWRGAARERKRSVVAKSASVLATPARLRPAQFDSMFMRMLYTA